MFMGFRNEIVVYDASIREFDVIIYIVVLCDIPVWHSQSMVVLFV